MSGPLPFELDDALIELTLSRRAGSSAPRELVPGILAAVAAEPQRRRLLPAPLIGRLSGPRLLAVAAVLAVALAGGAALIAGSLLSVAPPAPISPLPSAALVPTASPSSPAASEAPSSSPPPTPAPTPSASAAASSADDHSPLIAYRPGGPTSKVLAIDVVTGKRTQLGDLQGGGQGGQKVQLTADRSRAFIWSDSDVLQAVLNVSSAKLRGLPGLPVSGGTDSVSPQGDLIARIEDNKHIPVVDTDGFEVANLSLPDGLTVVLQLTWTPDGGAILASACDSCAVKGGPESWHLYVAPLDGGPVRVVGDAATMIFPTDISADGKLALFSDVTCDQNGNGCSGGVNTIRLIDGVVTRLSDGGGSPTWSPDGRRIAFQGTGSNQGIFVMDADGGNVRRLTSGLDGAPIWSPGGDLVLFSRVPTDPWPGDLWVVPAGGGDAHLVIRNAVADW
jgi:hypothetical protein